MSPPAPCAVALASCRGSPPHPRAQKWDSKQSSQPYGQRLRKADPRHGQCSMSGATARGGLPPLGTPVPRHPEPGLRLQDEVDTPSSTQRPAAVLPRSPAPAAGKSCSHCHPAALGPRPLHPFLPLWEHRSQPRLLSSVQGRAAPRTPREGPPRGHLRMFRSFLERGLCHLRRQLTEGRGTDGWPVPFSVLRELLPAH